jgi:hypothetical protein
MEKIYYQEEQKFDQIWFRLIILLSWAPMIVIFGTGIYQQIGQGKPWGDNPTSDTALLFTTICIFVIMTGVTWIAFSMRLITQVTKQGFVYRFPPLINKFKTIPKSMIKEYQVRKYSPIGEYGGWGIRRGIFGRGRAYNVKGNIGLQFRLQDDKKILFGTQRPEALKAAMEKMMNPPEY